MTSRKAVFRADSSTVMGSGHIMRCLTLADALAGRGYAVSFVCRGLPGNIIAAVTGRGYEAHTLPHRPEAAASLHDEYARLLGAPRETDAAETAAVLAAAGPVDLLVVDHYALDERWEKIMKPLAGRLLVIDDLGNRRHDCDFLLDQNYYRDMETRYLGLVPAGCHCFFGPRYALLGEQYRQLAGRARNRDGVIRRVMLFFGGGDPTDETTKALLAMKALDRPDIAVDVVVGGANVRHEAIRRLCAAMPNVSFHRQIPNMASIMDSADVAIGAGGVTMLERCLLGLPCITLTIADNQVATTAAVASTGAIWSLGRHDTVSAADIGAELRRLLDDPAAIWLASDIARSLMRNAGQGQDALVAALTEDE